MPSHTFAEAKALDKFYTKPAQARFALSVAKAYLSLLGQEFSEKRVLEPSAGAGVFLDVLGDDDHSGVTAFDIAPEDDRIARADFLTVPASVIGAERSRVITIGNPPFGKTGRLAVSFLNRALDLSDFVVMILPLTFRKWATQKQISTSASLVGDIDIPEDSFTVNGKDYSVRCCVQVWTTLPLEGTGLINLRKNVAPAIRHPDFECWQYNVTEEAKKYFDYDWDFGVLRQGYGDYSAFIRKGDRICHRKQWIFFKAKTPEVLARLQSIDFEDLSRTNISMPGFGKAEIVARYEKMFGEHKTLEEAINT